MRAIAPLCTASSKVVEAAATTTSDAASTSFREWRGGGMKRTFVRPLNAADSEAVRPGWVGWWAISGDLPTDYCSCEEPRHPRTAARTFAATWRAAADDVRPDGTLGETELPASLAEMLRSRADILDDWAKDDENWPD